MGLVNPGDGIFCVLYIIRFFSAENKIYNNKDKEEKMKRYHPFKNTHQYMIWITNNCNECFHGYIQTDLMKEKEVNHSYKCEAELALSLAYAGDGTVNKECAKFIGYLKNKDKYLWICANRKIKEK